MRRFAASLLLLTMTVQAWAASTGYYLGDSLRQLGLRELEHQRGDAADSERHGVKGGIVVYAERSKDFVLVDGVKVVLEDAVGSLRGHLTISRTDYEKVFVPLLWGPPRAATAVRRIVLDPGHGGKDPGKINAALGYAEKAATLDTAARLKIALEKRGFEVVFTRTKDEFIELSDRPDFAARTKADLFVSLHYNGGGAGDTTSSGIETYCLSPEGQRSTNSGKAKATTTAEPGNRFDSGNMALAWGLQRQLLSLTGAEDRGVRRARFAVLRTLSCPGVLVEGGFISSRKEGAQIKEDAYRQKIAEAVAIGVAEYAARVRPAQKTQN
ncbi:MAG: N-acetylmuramoyl-L-alanine amidase [Verrucomicrobiota bacterium]